LKTYKETHKIACTKPTKVLNREEPEVTGTVELGNQTAGRPFTSNYFNISHNQ